jgi:hypothetical protein
MDYEEEIRDLKAALLETKWAVASLGVCIAQTLAACDPKSHTILSSYFARLDGQARTSAPIRWDGDCSDVWARAN